MKDFSYKEKVVFIDPYASAKERAVHPIYCAVCGKFWTPKEGGEQVPKKCPLCGVVWERVWKLKKEKEKMNSFVKDLQHVINCHSRENDSDTPDFILAGLVEDLLHAFAKAQRARDKWYGFDPWSKLSGASGGSGDVPVPPKTFTEEKVDSSKGQG